MYEKRKEDSRHFLTAGQSSQICPSDEFVASIDRITLMAPLSLDAWESHFYEWLKLPFVEISGTGLQVLDKSNCDFDDFGNRHDHVMPEQVAFIEMARFQKDKVRIDFNPNHGMESEGGLWLKELLNKLPRKTFSRADIANDIFGHPEIAKYGVWNFGCSERIFLDKNRVCETIYWGKSSSRQQIRLYNKKVEREARHGEIVNIDSWWRLEMQLRGDKVEDYPSLVKNMLEHFYIPDFRSDNLTDNEQNKLARMMLDPFYYGQQSKKTQQRLRQIIAKAKPDNSLSIQIAKNFVETLPSLESELFGYLGRYHIDRK